MAVSTEHADNKTLTVVEHIVFMKLKETVSPETEAEMFKTLRDLKSLDGVLLLSAGPIIHIEGAGFTHVLHGRYKDKEALAGYSKHPQHVAAVKKFVMPNSSELLALDWECEPVGDFREELGAGRVTLMKVKEGTLEDPNALITSVNTFSSRFPGAGQVSTGTNFSPARSKGYNFGLLEFFESINGAEAVNSSEEHKKWQGSELEPWVDSLIVADYKF